MKHHILVVEDNAINRELLCEWLETEGYEVTAVEDLQSAFAALQKQELHAILLDIQVGAEDGASLATWVRQQKSRLREIPIIAVTAHAMAAERERILQSGCNSSISKPIDFKLLHDQMDRWLTISRISEKA